VSVRKWHEAAEVRRAEYVRSAHLIQTFNLFRYRKRIVDLDAEVPDRALDLYDRVEAARLVDCRCGDDQSHLGAPKRVGAVDARIEVDARDSIRDEPCVLPWHPHNFCLKIQSPAVHTACYAAFATREAPFIACK